MIVLVLVQTWCFATMILAALVMGTAFCHALELPAKMRYPAPLWTTLQNSLYASFGRIGAFLEPGAILAAAALAFLERGRGRVFGLTVAGAACLAAAFAIWWVFIFPVNSAVRQWTPESVPTDWTRMRKRWEYTHAARFVLQLIGLSMLVGSCLSDVPAGPRE